MHSPTIQKLINLFSKFPTIGPRTASRFVFYLLGLTEREIKELTSTILKLKEKVKLCKLCYKSFESSTISGQKVEGELCEICQDPRRDKSLICLVEKETDLISIEKTRKYQGLYFILGGEELKKIRTQEFLERVKNPEIGEEDKSSSSAERSEAGDERSSATPFAATQVKEVIIALNPIAEGESFALYLERRLKPLGKKTTRLGRGLPFGGELEYADEETLSSALEGRK
ncbi:MAG: toprim domain-containing protein [bacterium]|nr:toprim domain-containing protein [bacterium]